MSKTELTPKQEALIPNYAEKWREIAFSVRQITQQEAKEVIEFLYAVLGYREPTIILKSNPIDAVIYLFGEHSNIFELKIRTREKNKRIKYIWGKILASSSIKSKLVDPIITGTNYYDYSSSKYYLPAVLQNLMINPLYEYEMKLTSFIHEEIALKLIKDRGWLERQANQLKYWLMRDYSAIRPESWAYIGAIGDFYTTVLNGSLPPLKWKAVTELITKCGWIFPFQEVCFVCQRPNIIRLDSSSLWAKKDKTVIEFADGYQLW